MHHLANIASGVVGIMVGAVVTFYFSPAKAFYEAELKKVRDELNALKSKAKAKL